MLRKELESLVENEGSEVLALPELPSAHPIIFWNLLWYFQRLRLPSILPGLVLASCDGPSHPQAPSPWLTPDPASVQVRLLWDVLTPDPNSCPPLYVLWRVHSESGIWPGWGGWVLYPEGSVILVAFFPFIQARSPSGWYGQAQYLHPLVWHCWSRCCAMLDSMKCTRLWGSCWKL